MEVKKSLPDGRRAEAAALLDELQDKPAAIEPAPPPIDAAAAMADRLAENPPPLDELAGGEPRPPALNQEVAGIFAAVGAGLGAFFPSVKGVLDESKCDELGQVIAPVLEKYGLAQYFAGFAWRVELQAAFVVIPTVIAIKEAIQTDVAAMRQAAAERGAQALTKAPGAGDAGVLGT